MQYGSRFLTSESFGSYSPLSPISSWSSSTVVSDIVLLGDFWCLETSSAAASCSSVGKFYGFTRIVNSERYSLMICFVGENVKKSCISGK